MRAGLEAFDKHWSYEREGSVYLQASESPVWDTILSMLALLDTRPGTTPSPTFMRALDWLLDQQVRAWGDWNVYVRGRARRWLGVPARQQLLPRRRRHGRRDRRARPGTDIAARAPARRRGDRSGHRVDARHAVARTAAGRPSTATTTSGSSPRFPSRTSVSCSTRQALTSPRTSSRRLACSATAGSTPPVARALEYHPPGAGARGKLVRTLGRQSHLRHGRRAAGARGHRRGHEPGRTSLKAARLDRRPPERGRRLGRDARLLHGRFLARGRRQHAVADRLGADGAQRDARGRSTTSRSAAASNSSSRRSGRDVGRVPVHGHRLPRLQRGSAHRRSGNGPATSSQGIELQRAFMINYNLYRHYFPMMALGRSRRRFAERG